MAEISTVRLNLVTKKNTKSVVWNYFGIKADENGVQIPGEESRPICRTCHKTVVSKGGNTTNVFVHLRDGHPTLYKEATKTQAKPSKGKEEEGKQPTFEATVHVLWSEELL